MTLGSSRLQTRCQATWIDEQGGIYTADRKMLLRCPNVAWYRVREGTEFIDADAFHHCPMLEEVELPYTLKHEGELTDLYENDITDEEYEEWERWELELLSNDKERDDANVKEEYERRWYATWEKHKFLFAPSVGHRAEWDRSYAEEDDLTGVNSHDLSEGEEDEFGVVYSKNGHRLLMAKAKFSTVTEYTVRDGVRTLCDDFAYRDAFAGIYQPLVIHLPESVKTISESFDFLDYRLEGRDLIFQHELRNQRAEAIEMGEPDYSMDEIYHLLRQNLEEGKDAKRQFKDLLLMAQCGNPEAQHFIGFCYQFGYAVDQDPESAEYWLKEASISIAPRT